MRLAAEDYVFFWTTKHVNGWASQWFPASFTTTVQMNDQDETVTFPSTEHWMMFQKASLFGDVSIAKKVVSSTGTAKADMAYVKSLGRKVKNFKEDVWQQHRERIVYEGNMLKFRQNDELKQKLLDTGTKLIVEASPYDRIWGIGMGEKTAVMNPNKWGLNLLGKALVEVREALRDEEPEPEDQADETQNQV